MVSQVPLEQPWWCRSCGPRFLGVLEAAAIGAAAVVATVGFQQLLDDTRGLHAIELPDTLAKTLLGEGLDVVLLEVVVLDNFQDQRPLLFRA